MSKNKLFEHETKKEFNFFMAIIPLAVMVITMLYAIVVLGTDPHLPFAILNFTVPVIAIILAATGFGIAKISSEERDAYLAEHFPEEQEKPVTT